MKSLTGPLLATVESVASQVSSAVSPTPYYDSDSTCRNEIGNFIIEQIRDPNIIFFTFEAFLGFVRPLVRTVYPLIYPNIWYDSRQAPDKRNPSSCQTASDYCNQTPAWSSWSAAARSLRLPAAFEVAHHRWYALAGLDSTPTIVQDAGHICQDSDIDFADLLALLVLNLRRQ